MNRLIATPSDIERLDAEAKSWEYAPFFKGSRAKGRDGGVDCVNLQCAILAAFGLVIPPLPDDYPLDHTYHNATSLIELFVAEAGLEHYFHVTDEVVREDFRPGDILHFKMENEINHLVMMLSRDKIVNCINPWGVRIVRLDVVMRLGNVVRVRTPLKV